MANYAANNLFDANNKHAPSCGAKRVGIIASGPTPPHARWLIDGFAAPTKTWGIQYIPRSPVVAQVALYGQPVIEASPQTPQADKYRQLGRTISEGPDAAVNKSPAMNDLRNFARKWGDVILDAQIVSPPSTPALVAM